jgi:hypothetical protein
MTVETIVRRARDWLGLNEYRVIYPEGAVSLPMTPSRARTYASIFGGEVVPAESITHEECVARSEAFYAAERERWARRSPGEER